MIDRGSGIEPEHLENIFNPFFTTKPEGVGLGLAIVSKIVDEHGGTHRGRERTIEGQHLSRLPARVASDIRGQAFCILLVDEKAHSDRRRRREAAPRDAAATASAGFEVEKAGTAEEALKLVDRADLILTDLRLPGMDGLELLSPIRGAER